MSLHFHNFFWIPSPGCRTVKDVIIPKENSERSECCLFSFGIPNNNALDCPFPFDVFYEMAYLKTEHFLDDFTFP